MKRIINFKDFNVFSIEKEVWDIEYHNHNFYELIIIKSGKGKHRVNDITFNYKGLDVFFLRPNDKHEFSIEKKTQFIYIKFTEKYIITSLLPNKSNIIKETLQLLMEGNSITFESAIRDKTERLHFKQLAQLLLHEFSVQKSHIVQELFSTIMIILCRNLININSNKKYLPKRLSKIERILSYINVHALDPAKMKIENIAIEFLFSPAYVSIYVKNETGLSIQQHIIQYKMKIAEELLSQRNYSIKEIANKLSFIDSSHFYKAFKKHKNMTPSNYRSSI